MVECALTVVPPGPGSPEETWGLQPPLPTEISGPLPQPVLSAEEQASSDLSAGSLLQGADPFYRTPEGWECWSLLGGPVLHPSPPRLSPARIPPPTLGSRFSGSRPDITISPRDPLNGQARWKVDAGVLVMGVGPAGGQ